MANQTLLCVDPGGTTGFALISYTETTEPVLIKAWQVKDGLKGILQKEWLKEEFNLIVCENFTLRNSVTFPDLSPVYIIGALEAYNVAPIVYQRPADKPLCNDDILKRIGMYQRGMPHANDAIRHGIIYLRKQRHLPTLIKGWKND